VCPFIHSLFHPSIHLSAVPRNKPHISIFSVYSSLLYFRQLLRWGRRPDGDPNEIPPSNIEVQNTSRLNSHSRNVLMILRYREDFNRRECPKNSMYPQTAWTVLATASNPRPSGMFQAVRNSRWRKCEPWATSALTDTRHMSHKIWQTQMLQRNFVFKEQATNRGQTTLLCILTAIFVVPKLRCREWIRQTVFTCFRGVEITVLVYNAAISIS